MTAEPGVSRAAQLAMLGNGVVRQQGALALSLLTWHFPAMECGT